MNDVFEEVTSLQEIGVETTEYNPKYSVEKEEGENEK